MNRIIGDRREKSVLEEMEEVVRERNADVAEEERLEALRKAKKVQNPKTPPMKIPVTKTKKPEKTIYSWMEIEPKAEENNNVSPILKQEYTYTRSLLEIKKREYLRHCYPADAFAIICDGLEGKLDSALKPVFEDMIKGKGEWLSMAFERKGDLLIAYLHPEGFSLDGGINDPDNRSTITYTSEMKFDIKSKKSGRWIPLKEMSDDFNEAIYGRKYANLPQTMRDGLRASVMLPPDDLNIYPIARKDSSEAYSITYNLTYSGSRGVRPRRKR